MERKKYFYGKFSREHYLFEIISLILHPLLEDKNKKLEAMNVIKDIQNELIEMKEFPKFGAGDTVIVAYKIKEGNKERIQQYQGVVLQRRGSGATETFTVRKMSGNVGVERIFPISSPFIDTITVTKRGAVRRARIFYFRERTGKSARIKEKRSFAH